MSFQLCLSPHFDLQTSRRLEIIIDLGFMVEKRSNTG